MAFLYFDAPTALNWYQSLTQLETPHVVSYKQSFKFSICVCHPQV
jgi:hypothetical protein